MTPWAEAKAAALDATARAYWAEVRALATGPRGLSVSLAARLSGTCRADARRYLERYAADPPQEDEPCSTS